MRLGSTAATFACWSVAATVAAADAAALNGAAWSSFLSRDFAAAEAAAREAWSAAGAAGGGRPAGVAAANVAAGLAMRGRFDEALEWSQRADERLAAAASTKARGRLAAARAVMLYASGARADGERAFAAAEAWLGQDDFPLAFVRLTVRVYVEPHSNTAHEGLTALLQKARGAGDRARILRCLLALGWAETFFDPATSMARYGEARPLAAAGTDAEVHAYAAYGFGAAHLRTGGLDAAGAAFAEGLAEARRSGDRRLQVVLHDALSLLHAQKGDDTRAREEDVAAQRLLAAMGEDLREGRIADTVLLDFRQLSKVPYLNLPTMLFPLFGGLFDQLALDPASEEE